MTDKFKELTENLGTMGGRTWNIGFDNQDCDDETQFDLDPDEGAEALYELWKGFCEENDLSEDCLTYIEEGFED